MGIDMPMISITVIDMTNSNFNFNRKQHIPRGVSSKINEMLLEDFPQISSQFIF
jgi:hypothetical protein